MKKLNYLILAATVAMAVSAQGQSTLHYDIGAIDTGRYDNTGYHDSQDKGFFVGSDGTYVYHDYFVFDLSGISAGIISQASLTVFYGTSITPNTVETFNLRATSMNIPLLEANHGLAPNPPPMPSLYSGLSSGVLYGSKAISGSDDGSVPETITLNSSFLSGVQPLLGSGQLALGGSLQGITLPTAQPQEVFLYTLGPVELSLDITPVPEPSTLALAGLGGLALLACRRRK